MKRAVLFDLGNTLVRYYTRGEWPGILSEALGRVRVVLEQEGIPAVSAEQAWETATGPEYHEADDHRVRPLEGRLARIFRLEESAASAYLIGQMCNAFMQPIFTRAVLYDDVMPAVTDLKSSGLRTAIVSNTPYGSPAHLWREEVARHGLDSVMDAVVFCRDVGWRKPARQVFEHVLEELDAGPADCVFVGDDPRWDVTGPQAVGIHPILIDRDAGSTDPGVINSLHQLLKLPELGDPRG